MTNAQAFAVLRQIEANSRALATLERAGIDVEIEPDGSWCLVIRRREWEEAND